MKKYRLNFPSAIMAHVRLNRNALIVYELYEDIDGDKLSEAVNKAMGMHPIYKTKLVREADGYYLVENAQSPVIKNMPWETELNYGTSEFHDFPWLIHYDGAKIIFIVAHFMTDGMGQMAFMKTVLRFYLEMQGVVFSDREGLLTPGEIKETTEDGYRFIGQSGSSNKSEPQGQMLPDSFYNEDRTPNILTHFELNRSDISGLSRENGTSSFAELASITAKALSHAAKLDQGNILLNTAVDLRNICNSRTDFLFNYTPNLCYDCAGFSHISSSAAAKSLKNQLIESTKKENIDAYISSIYNLNQQLNPQIMDGASLAFKHAMTARQAYIVYSHVTHVGYSEEMEKHIRRIYLSGTKGHNARIILHAVNFKDTIYVNLAQDSKNDILADCFAGCLDEAGVRYQKHFIPGHGRLLYNPDFWD